MNKLIDWLIVLIGIESVGMNFKVKEVRDNRDKERKRKSRKESIRPDSNCELCGGEFPLPVTLHMRQAHPGCHKPALGLGYNPEGHYCGGWVGNCGEGGIQVTLILLLHSSEILEESRRLNRLNNFAEFNHISQIL